MSNFKLKHQSKAPLLNSHKGKYYMYEPPIQPRFEKYVEPPKIKRPKRVEYIPSVRNELMPELPKVETFRPILEDPNKFQNLENMRLLDESNRMQEEFVKTQRAKNAEKNRIKYENQELKRKQFEEQKRKFDESMRKHRELVQNLPEIVRTPTILDEKPIDATTGKPYDDSAEGRQERLAREQEAGMRDEMGYQTSNYEGGVALMKRNSATPYKLPHQSNSAFRYGHHGNPPFAPEEEVPSFQETFANSSGGKLTPDEKTEAIRLLDSTKNTYMNREFIRKGNYDPEQRKVIFENVPISEEENLAEWDREKGNYYVDFNKDGEAFVKSVPRGDDDIPVQSFLKGLDPSQYRGEFFSDLPDDYVDPGLTPGHPLNPNEGYHRVDNFRN